MADLEGTGVGQPLTILLLEDEPLILLDLEFAVEDYGHNFVSATCTAQGLDFLADTHIDVAILDVSLGKGETCVPVADALRTRGIPFIIHSGDLDRRNETIRGLGARVIGKPAASDRVVAEALKELDRDCETAGVGN